MSLGENIKKRRREMNLTQEQLGDALNVHANTIRKWEKGISHPDTLELEQIAKILNVSISYLYAETSTTSRTVKFVKNSAYQDRTEINDNSVPSMAYWGSLVDNAEKIPPNQWKVHVTFPSYRRSKAAYPHPFAVYGTDIAQKGLSVIYLASNRTADNIIETLANYGIKQDCGVICLVDFALSLAERRKLAQAFKLRPDLKDIIVIDRVMAIFLTRFVRNRAGSTGFLTGHCWAQRGMGASSLGTMIKIYACLAKTTMKLLVVYPKFLLPTVRIQLLRRS